jgi:hypothetical protein
MGDIFAAVAGDTTTLAPFLSQVSPLALQYLALLTLLLPYCLPSRPLHTLHASTDLTFRCHSQMHCCKRTNEG